MEGLSFKVLRRQLRVLDRPGDIEVRIIPLDTVFRVWMIEIGALVSE